MKPYAEGRAGGNASSRTGLCTSCIGPCHWCTCLAKINKGNPTSLGGYLPDSYLSRVSEDCVGPRPSSAAALVAAGTDTTSHMVNPGWPPGHGASHTVPKSPGRLGVLV